MNKKQRIVHGQEASNENYSTVVFNFDVCRLSQPLSSTNYVTTEQNFGIFSQFRGWFPPRIYLATLANGVGAYSGKSADYRALFDRNLVT